MTTRPSLQQRLDAQSATVFPPPRERPADDFPEAMLATVRYRMLDEPDDLVRLVLTALAFEWLGPLGYSSREVRETVDGLMEAVPPGYVQKARSTAALAGGEEQQS